VFLTFTSIVLVSLKSLKRLIVSFSSRRRRVSYLELVVIDVRALVLYHLFFYPDVKGSILFSFLLPLRAVERSSEGLGKT